MDDKQDMLTVGDECHHGRLKRQCQECDMEQEIKELKEQNEKLTETISKLLDVDEIKDVNEYWFARDKAVDLLNKLRGD